MTESQYSQPAPGQFRKKLVVIEAMQWDGSWDSAEAIKAAFPTMDVCSATLHPPSQTVRAWSIRTLEGSHAVSVGDWIIKGIKGEFYPCKPEIFAATYEPAEAAIPATEGGDAPLVVKTAPARIWLQVSDDADHNDRPFPASTHGDEVTWCQDQVLACEVEYIRADLAAQPQAPVALTPEQKRAMWKASDFRGSGGQIDWYVKGIEDAERVHGITQTKEPTNDR